MPKEWAEKDVNVVLVLEFLNQLQESKPKKKVWPPPLLTCSHKMPEDFMAHRQDDLPQERDEWL